MVFDLVLDSIDKILLLCTVDSFFWGVHYRALFFLHSCSRISFRISFNRCCFHTFSGVRAFSFMPGFLTSFRIDSSLFLLLHSCLFDSFPRPLADSFRFNRLATRGFIHNLRLLAHLFSFPASKVLVLGMGDLQPLIGNPYNGYINPYYWVDDHPLLYGNNGSLDPSTCLSSVSVFIPPTLV